MLSQLKKETAGSNRSSAKWMFLLVAIALGIATLVFLLAIPGGAVLPLTFGAALMLGDFAPAATHKELTD